MPDLATNLLLSAAVFAGAFVSGMAGFAFSAVAGAILLRIFQPLEAVPLMMACSVAVQAANLWALRKNIQWHGSLMLVVGGALGLPIAVYLLRNADTTILRVGFGIVVSLYAAYMLFQPTFTHLTEKASARLIALVGFGGGLIGGLTAMPGAVPTIWCDMRGMPKGDQRGLVQPFIAIMQLFALALLLERHSLSSRIMIDLAISLPALLAGSALGILAFRNINEFGFRKIVLVVLLFSGISLAVA
ncbi:sulfite exporter TauE/SafE family protein [Bradyrhizobium sp.]|uniref:sulfite exporter TauE/SafE family protein n=1 Tax=Bradyrhizobium sp. TaxID=376 RepID=UPI003C76DDEE